LDNGKLNQNPDSETSSCSNPLKRAAAAGLRVSEPTSFRYIPGRGIICSSGADDIIVGNRLFFAEQGINLNMLAGGSDPSSEVLVAQNGRFLGRLRIADRLRPEAIQAVAEMRSMHLRVILLTGDVDAIAKSVGRQLRIDEIHSELLPEQKLEYIRRLVTEGQTVAMVGDGINDAPALMQAHVGAAMGSGTDVARESANVMLLGNDLLKFVETLRIARWCHRIIMTNFAGTLIVDGVGVGLAAFGLLSPLLAAFIHVASELAFILNSARLLPRRSSSRTGA
jgi:P-type E1-E2 ATPase